jgi:sulfur carrier protein ThiS
MIVKVARVGGETQEIEVPNDSSVLDVISQAGEDIGGCDVRVNGTFVDDPGKVIPTRNNETVVTIVPEIRGG